MPLRHSLLRLEVPALQSVDTSRVEDLFGMWSLFSKASHAVEDGRRLENLSWRLWNRETFCCHRKSQSRSSSSSAISIRDPKAASADIPVPELSSSLDSVASDDFEEQSVHSARCTASTTLPQARPELRCDSGCVNRGNEKHITAVDLEKIVISIRESKDLEQKPIELPVSTPAVQPRTTIRPSTSTPHLPELDLDATEQLSDTTEHAPLATEARMNTRESSASTDTTVEDQGTPPCGSEGSETSSSTEMSTHSVIRGFVPGGAPSSYRSQTNLSVAQPTPILKSLPQTREERPKGKGAMFTIGTSSGEDESSLESHMLKSALSASLKRPGSTLSGASNRKQTSFKDEVAVGRAAEHSPVFESDDEDEEVSESAIEDDDDSSDWEDSEDQSAHSSVNEKDLFQRVDSRPQLTSRRSLLTTLMHEPDRARALANAASRSTPALQRSRQSTPNGPSVATSPSPEEDLHMPTRPQSGARPIILTTSNTHHQPMALSPKSTRRNMLSTELTESLRKNLLWERQHKSTTNMAALRRRHTSNDVQNLKQHPEPTPVLQHGRGNFTNDYFHAGLQEYHTKGW